jgi:hypothetical protein
MPLLALTPTRSPLAVSAVGLAVRLPWLVVALPAGVVVDRHPPMAMMRFAAAARLPLIAIAAALAAGRVLSVWELAAVAFAVASAGTFVDISAQSVLPRMLIVAGLLPAAGGTALALGRFPLAQAGEAAQLEQEGLCTSRSWTPTRPRSGRSARPSRPVTG